METVDVIYLGHVMLLETIHQNLSLASTVTDELKQITAKTICEVLSVISRYLPSTESQNVLRNAITQWIVKIQKIVTTDPIQFTF